MSNQTTQSSPGIPFKTNSLNIQTTDDNTIEIIDHELIIEVLPVNDPITNTNFITTDAFNRLHSSPISSLPPPTPPTIDFIANDVLEPNSIMSIDSSNKQNKSLAYTDANGAIITSGNGIFGDAVPVVTEPTTTLKLVGDSPLSTYKEGETRPRINLTNSDGFDNSAININCYENDIGQTIMSKIRGFKCFQTSTDTWLLATGSASIGDENTGQLQMNFRYNNYTQFYLRVRLGPGIFSNTSANDHICTLSGSQNECVKLPRESLFEQDLLPTSNVTYNRLFATDFIQTDQILENTLNEGVRVDSWLVKSQAITSDGLSNVLDPLSINLKYFADSNIPLSITAPAHDNLAINFDCHNVVGLPDNYISGSILGNIILDKSDDLFRILVTNSVSPGLGFLKSSMSSVLEAGKTFINLNQVCTFAQGIIASALTIDPETQADSIFITQSSITNEITKRPYQSVYASCINTVSVITPLLLNIWTVPDLQYAFTVGKNCTPILNTITIDGSIDSHLSSISYDISCASEDNLATSYQSAIRINNQIVTSSICNFIIDSNMAFHNIANTSLFTINENDDISLVVRNIINNKPLSVSKMCITINKVFQ